MTKSAGRPGSPGRVLVLVVAIFVSWMLGCLVVRVGLDWSDTFPYSAASETRYLGVAVCALLVGTGGTVASVLVFRRQNQRP